MTCDKFSQNQAPAIPQPSGAGNSNQSGIDFTPSTDDVAGRGCFSYADDPPPHSQDGPHRPEAKVKLLTEGNRTDGSRIS